MSNIDHKTDAAKRGSAALIQVGVSIPQIYPHIPVRHAGGAVMNYPASSQVVLHQHKIHTYFNSTTSTQNVLGSSGFVDVRLPAQALQVITGVTLELKLSNDTELPITLPANSFTLLDRVEILAEGGNQVIARFESSALMFPFRFVDALSYERFARGFESPGPLGPGETRSIYLPILQHPLASNHVYGGSISSDMYVRCWFRGTTGISSFNPQASPEQDSANSSIPTLKSLNVVVAQDYVDADARRSLQVRAKKERLDFRFQRPGYQSMTEHLAPGQRYSWQLTAIHGLVSELIILIRDPTNKPGSFYTRPIASVELLDSSGTSVLGGGALPMGLLQQDMASKQTSRALDFPNGGPPVVLEFGSARDDLSHGTISGYLPMNGSYQLAITTGVGPFAFNADTYEIIVYYNAAACLSIEKGQISVRPS